MSDFHDGFGYGVAIGLGLVAVMILVAPRRYVDNIDRATFRCVWLVAALRAALAPILGLPSQAEREMTAFVRTRVDSAIGRRRDPQVDRTARGIGAVLLGCSVVTLLWPPALVAAVSVTAMALAVFILRLEARQPDVALRRAAALRPRPTFDPALQMAIGVAGVLIAADLGLSVISAQPPPRGNFAIGGVFGLLILALALRLARRPAAISADDVAIDAYVDEHFRVTRVAYLLALSLFPSAVAIFHGAVPGSDGLILRTTYEIGFLLVVAAWFAAALRGPKTADT